MKKFLIATTALIATASVASAEIKLSGYGRFGLDHNDSRGVGNNAYSQVNARMRITFDATTETDSGVTFGARFRMQQSTNSTGATLNAAQFNATYAGLRMEVGNSNSAIDAGALLYNSEIGYLDRGFGDPIGNFSSYSSTPYGAAGRMGVYASYAFGEGTVRGSYINPDQTVRSLPAGTEAETSISADYKFNQFTIAGAYADNANFVDGDTSWYLGAEYALMPNANIGLLYFEDKDDSANTKQHRTTLYGNYTMDALTFKGYIANDNNVANLTDTSFGVGVDYAMGGGTRLAADVHRNYNKDAVAGIGVRFNF